MPVSRRRFLQLTANSAFIITTANVLQPLHTDIFKDMANDTLLCRMAIASDGHYGQPGTDYEMHHEQMVEWINAEKKTKGIDFAFINGDMFHNDALFIDEVKGKWDKLTMPYYISHGNHDETSEEHWQRVWKLPWHYAFEHKGIGIIVLNTADDKGNYICPDIAWAKAQLEKYALKKQVFVFMHITPFKWTKGGIDCPAIVELFDKQKNLKAIFHGHDHDQDDIKINNGRYYFFDSHIAGNWGTPYHGYRIVEVFKSGKILTYQMNAAANLQVNNKDIS